MPSDEQTPSMPFYRGYRKGRYQSSADNGEAGHATGCDETSAADDCTDATNQFRDDESIGPTVAAKKLAGNGHWRGETPEIVKPGCLVDAGDLPHQAHVSTRPA